MHLEVLGKRPGELFVEPQDVASTAAVAVGGSPGAEVEVETAEPQPRQGSVVEKVGRTAAPGTGSDMLIVRHLMQNHQAVAVIEIGG